MKKLFWIGVIASILVVSGCNKTEEVNAFGDFSLKVKHEVEGEALKTDALIYTNAAGNRYMVTEIQWFISDIQLIKEDVEATGITQNVDENIFYIDTDIEETHTINSSYPIPSGNYSGIRFTFGLAKEANKSHRFVNPPESFMFWPEYLGGGYHYMKLNGKWINEAGVIEPFNFHLGIGQEYDEGGKSGNDLFEFGDRSHFQHCDGYRPPQKLNSVTAFIHNNFSLMLPLNFIIKTDEPVEIDLIMNIEKWFYGYKVYDHDVWGGAIMQQQEAMDIACRNGMEVFSLRSEK
ncbi:MAG: hypothetical protein RBR87_08835 [Bacteroidales bacterium]|jgi:hypothetical protein|nr:hypothetical protein [Bacteroidales bacterium]